MYKACAAKFTQNMKLQDFLLSTGDNDLVEGNPKDALWGVKLSVQDPDIFNKTKWNGRNWMGDILQRVRDELK